MNEKRKHKRILAVCQAFDDHNQLLGFSLDLTPEGIRLIVAKNFLDQAEFFVTLKDQHLNPSQEVRVKVKKRWREPKDDDFDEIGGLLIDISSRENFQLFLENYRDKAEFYDFDL